MVQRSSNRGAIPAHVADTLALRLSTAINMQRAKLEFIRVYGRERGLFEYAVYRPCPSRSEVAMRIREARAICLRNGARLTNAMFDLFV